MALFKVSRGNSAGLPVQKNDGYCYITKDGKKFYFDYLDDNNALQRGELNAANADTVNNKTVLANVPSDAKFTDTIYIHPSYSLKASGLYKITIDNLGHISAAVPVTKADITALGIPASDTTYNEATTTVAGLLSTSDKVQLNNLNTNLNAKAAKSTSITVSLAAGSWSNRTQTVAAPGITSAANIVVGGALPVSNHDNYNIYGIRCTAQGTNTLTFTCDIAPGMAINASVIIIG